MLTKIVHFHNGKEGGVFSVIKNLIGFQQSKNVENHIIYTINKDDINEYKLPNIQNVKSQKVFYYSSKCNFHFTCKQLAKLLPDDSAVIVAHDWLELGMVCNLGLNNPVIQVVHGDFDYYYDLTNKHQVNIDFILGVSPIISTKLKRIVDCNKVIDWRFPISSIDKNINFLGDVNIAFFVSDLNELRKNYSLLPKIDRILIDKKIYVNWMIAGGGLNEIDNKLLWHENSHSRIHFKGFLNDIQINEMLKNCNAMILPSFKEGLPVSVVEAMKRGIVPFVSFWDGAVECLVIEGETGFYADPSNAEDFANKIGIFFKNSALRNKMSLNAKRKADGIFNLDKSVNEFENLTLKIKSKKGVKFKTYGSRLDNEFIPNILVKFLRKIKNHA